MINQQITTNKYKCKNCGKVFWFTINYSGLPRCPKCKSVSNIVSYNDTFLDKIKSLFS